MCVCGDITETGTHIPDYLASSVVLTCYWLTLFSCFLLMKQHCWCLSGKYGSRSTAFRGACETLGDQNIRIHKHTNTNKHKNGQESSVYNTQLPRWKNTKKNPQIRRHSHHLSSNPVLASGGYLKQNLSRVLPLLAFTELSAVHFCILSNATHKYPD